MNMLITGKASMASANISIPHVALGEGGIRKNGGKKMMKDRSVAHEGGKKIHVDVTDTM